MTAPKDAQACSACMFGLFQEIFPFLRTWASLFLAWTVVFVLWCLAGRFARIGPPGKPGRTVLEMPGVFFIIVATGYTVLLAYWAAVVVLQLRMVWKGTGTLAAGLRQHPEPNRCVRAESAAGLLGELRDTASVGLLASALSLTQARSSLAETAKIALRRIDSVEAREALKKTAIRERSL
ncbi:MAG: hypothetical protein OEW15_13945 [Nitrospirota bacterium]|nr:hypothetical protein [Nitrospirota bacterium]